MQTPEILAKLTGLGLFAVLFIVLYDIGVDFQAAAALIPIEIINTYVQEKINRRIYEEVWEV